MHPIAVSESVLVTVAVFGAVIPCLLAATLLAAWAIERIESGRYYRLGPHKISPRERLLYAGQFVAIEQDTGEIVCADHDEAVISVRMVQRGLYDYDVCRIPEIGDCD